MLLRKPDVLVCIDMVCVNRRTCWGIFVHIHFASLCLALESINITTSVPWRWLRFSLVLTAAST
eukprot:m.355312 g.355312  ORF g.355312 m.355312 type:complete len:64 (+) comp17218_c0_seq1:166-357(+)